MKNIMTVPILVCSVALSACQSTEVSYFAQPTENMRISTQNVEDSGYSAGTILLGLILIGAVVAAASCRPGRWLHGYNASIYDPGTC